MTQNKIKELIEESKKSMTGDYDAFEESIKNDLASFKKKTLNNI